MIVGWIKKILALILIFIMTGCAQLGLSTVNLLAFFDDYKLTDNIAYGEHALNKLDIYQPQNKSKGTIVFFYGGCWGACGTLTKGDYRFVAQSLTAKGYNVVIPDYRVYPKVGFKAIMDDASDAVNWVVATGKEYGLNVQNLYLMGHSAGGHIAAMLTVNERYLGEPLQQQISGYIGLASPYDFIFDKPYLPKVFAQMDFNESQPSYFVEGNEPPLLLLYGDADTSVYRRNIEKMEAKVKAKSGRVEAHIYKGVDHVGILSALSIPLRSQHRILNDIVHFLESNRADNK